MLSSPASLQLPFSGPEAARLTLLIITANVLLDQLGLPIPAAPALFFAGALAVSAPLWTARLLVLTILAGLVANVVWFVAGRRYGNRVMHWICRISVSPDSCVQQTQLRFERWGNAALLLAKFIPGLTIMGPALAGALRMRWLPFLGISLAAAAVWGGSLMLHALLQSGAAPLIFDVRSASARTLEPRAIPGALQISADVTAEQLRSIPRDREVVLYCTCPNEASAALVARQLRRQGVTRVRPLRGGLEAWIAADLPIQSVARLTETAVPAPGG